MRVVLIGAGINGLVAANYLARAGHVVTILERTARIGGACSRATFETTYGSLEYALGATTFGMMPRFIFEETGLAERITLCPVTQKEFVYIQDRPDLTRDAEPNPPFEGDLEKVVSFLQAGFQAAQTPSLQAAEKALGPTLTQRWITGDAKTLLDHYFQNETEKLLHAMCVNESGPVSLHEPFSAFTIPLMYSGSVLDGAWGFVKGGIWQITEILAQLNTEQGVTLLKEAVIEQIDEAAQQVRYIHSGGASTLSYDTLLFATDPATAAALLQDQSLQKQIRNQRVVGTSGKLVLFFKQPVRWRHDPEGKTNAAFRQLICTPDLETFDAATNASRQTDPPFVPGYLEIYPESAALRQAGETNSIERLTVYIKHIPYKEHTEAERVDLEKQVLTMLDTYIENLDELVAQKLFTPWDLQTTFFWPGGNIDHTEIADGQTYFTRTYSADPETAFYQFGTHEHIYYCGAGAYPCGSVAGTPGYMCAKQLLDKIV